RPPSPAAAPSAAAGPQNPKPVPPFGHNRSLQAGQSAAIAKFVSQKTVVHTQARRKLAAPKLYEGGWKLGARYPEVVDLCRANKKPPHWVGVTAVVNCGS